MTRDRSDVHFAQFDMGGEEPGIPIPARDALRKETALSSSSAGGETHAEDGTASSANSSSDAMNQRSRDLVIKHDLFDSEEVFDVDRTPARKLSLEQRFVAYGREHEDRVERDAAFVPFKSYWPTYESMAPSQLRWYFYWRGEVREGRYPDTDLSYIFLYIYELINGIGWVQAMDGYQLLLRIWEAYQKRYPKLNVYLPEWVTDFKVVHRLDVPFQDIVDRTPRGLGGLLLEMELMNALQMDPIQVSWRSLLKLSDYDAAKSKFYQQEGKDALEAYAPRALALVDGYFSKMHGTRLMEKYRPVTRNRKKFLFRSTVYDESRYGDLTDIDIMEVTSCAKLRKFVTELIRCVENELREQMGFRGRLRNIKLEPDVAKLVHKFVVREYAAQEAEKHRIVVEIDTAKLKQLQQDSDQVRELLTVEEETGLTESAPLLSFSIPSTTVETEQLELRLDDSRTEDEMEGSASFFDTAKESRPITQEAEGEQPVKELDVTHIKEPIDLFSFVPGSIEEPQEGDKLSPEWEELRSLLQPMHKEALQLLVQGETVSALAPLAMRYGSMTDLLVDDLNSLAMECIGDLLVDSDMLLEEYVADCRKMLGY
ncbi:TerB N-terminal domain-containing protein [Paenibacillus sp. 1001270B_150601_E10]|uniref:TerB N-terminal domain-containing protein n=1 Tax=Paenibacillus sp. 1001270B_150601_E10 TaxID=2787079 RepID=UPI00189F6A42|nr:TerB N-terminal domain-containing protein [Paenibacillus sp. 1001270B_150601_E10]